MKRSAPMKRTGFTRKPKPVTLRFTVHTPQEMAVARVIGDEVMKAIRRETKARKRLRSRRRDPETRAADQAYRETVVYICRRIGGPRVCEAGVAGVCACGGRAAVVDTNHIDKRSHYGRKSQGLRDHPDNLIRLCRRAHDWTDRPMESMEGKLVVAALGGERFTFAVLRTGRFALLGIVNPMRYRRPQGR